MRRIVIAVAAALGALGVAGCGGTEEPTFTENERSIEVQAGERFRVEFAANPGVGDAWILAHEPDADVARLVDDGFASDADEDVVGASGTKYFVFDAVGTGATELGFRYCYRGCGEAEGEPPERSVTFDVAVG
jgi:inhibitor of cysteine peptidase